MVIFTYPVRDKLEAVLTPLGQSLLTTVMLMLDLGDETLKDSSKLQSNTKAQFQMKGCY